MKMKWTLLLAAGLIAGQAYAGYQITIQSVSDGNKGHGRRSQTQGQPTHSVIQMATDGDMARIDFKEGQGPGAGEGGYLVTTNAGKPFYMVSPKDKTYMKWDMESMMGLAGAMGGMMKMKISDPKVEMLLDEAGEKMLGYSTRHYKFRTSYQMSMTVMGFKNESSVVKEEETWTTKQLDITTLGSWFSKMPKTNNEDLDKLIQAEKGKMTGMPLKTLSVQTNTDGEGKSTVTRTSMEVTEIKKIGAGDVAAEIPADYKEMDLFQAATRQDDGTSGEQPAARRSSPKVDFGSLFKKALESAQ